MFAIFAIFAKFTPRRQLPRDPHRDNCCSNGHRPLRIPLSLRKGRGNPEWSSLAVRVTAVRDLG